MSAYRLYVKSGFKSSGVRLECGWGASRLNLSRLLLACKVTETFVDLQGFRFTTSCVNFSIRKYYGFHENLSEPETDYVS